MGRRSDDLTQYRRPAITEPAVAQLLARCGVAPEEAEDLGGTMSLNVRLRDREAVLRVHPRFVGATRLRRLRSVRTWLAEEGDVPAPPPRPVVATYAPPGSLRRWLAVTEASVVDDPAAAEITARARVLVRTLARRWTPARQLPTHPVHGDIRLGNVAVAPSDDPVYLDFGFAAVRPRIHELAYSLFWIVLRPDDTGRPEQFDWAAIDELIGAYEQSAHSRLDDRERSALPAYLAAVPLYLAGVAGYTPDPVATLRGEEASLRIAEWVLTHLT